MVIEDAEFNGDVRILTGNS